MEVPHDQYLMWMKKMNNSSLPFGVNNYSWEEKAFAEDAARILGGCIWPPRSYSCNFCKREFKSAQALGGHMNVHRRDRARLKQSLSCLTSQNDQLALHPHHHKNYDCKSSSLSVQFSSDSSSCPNNNNPNYSNLTSTKSSISSSSPSSTFYSIHETFGQKNCSSISWGQNNSELPKGVVNFAKKEGSLKGLECNDYVETSLAVGKNSSCEDKGISYKRAKIGSVSTSVAGFLKPCSNDRLLSFQSAEFVLGHKKPGMEDLDLELRLGGKTQKVI